MKKLISANEVKDAAKKGQKQYFVDSNTIITLAAKDLARDLGIEFTTTESTANPMTVGNPISNNSVTQQKSVGENEIDPEMIFQVVKAVLTNKLMADIPASAPETPFSSDRESKSGLKVVRGRTVKLETFDTGSPGTNVAYREVISKEESKMSAGFLTIEKSTFEWELDYEEIDVVLEGSLSITINGETYHAHQGDALLVPKGSKVTWSSSDYAKLFYVTYPANWADLRG